MLWRLADGSDNDCVAAAGHGRNERRLSGVNELGAAADQSGNDSRASPHAHQLHRQPLAIEIFCFDSDHRDHPTACRARIEKSKPFLGV